LWRGTAERKQSGVLSCPLPSITLAHKHTQPGIYETMQQHKRAAEMNALAASGGMAMAPAGMMQGLGPI